MTMVPVADVDRWLPIVRSADISAFRLEQAPIYLGDVRSGAMNAWLAGDMTPRQPTEWTKETAREIAAGKIVERVRVVEDPMTPYQEWLRWASAKDVKAGEIHRYIARPLADEIGLTDYGADWWLLDQRALVVFHFDGLEQTHVEIVEGGARVEEAISWWKLAVANGRLETYTCPPETH